MKQFFTEVLLLVALLAAGACRSAGDAANALPPMRFDGARSFPSDQLREVVATEVGDAVKDAWTRSAVDDGAFALERFYASEGFGFAHVDWEITHADTGKDRAMFRIEEGPRVVLQSLGFEGAKAMRRETLESFFPAIPKADSGVAWWVESELEGDAKDLEDYYYKSGYLDARVFAPKSAFDKDRRHAQVRIEIVEGILSKLGKIELKGAPEDSASPLQHAADEFLGRPYSPLVAGAVRVRLEEVLATRGYADAKATPDTAERGADGSTSIAFTILPGPRVTIASIEIRGAHRTKPSTIEGLLKLAPGDVYSIEKERESFRALYQSGLFSTVRVGLAPGAEAARTLVVEVAEANSAEFYVEPGYGSYERLRLGLGMRLKNLFGTGRSLEVDGSLAELAQRGRISLITPNVMGTDVRSTVSVFSNRRVEPSFISRENGAAWNLARHLTRRLSATLGYEFRATDVSNVSVVGPAVQALINAVSISSIALTPVFDTRDSVFVPSRGGISKVTVELADSAIGSQLDFFRLRFAHSTYLPVWETGVLALSWRAGLIVPTHASDTIPLQERFFNGGESTVRSFREEQLGPKDAQGNPLGGEAFHIFAIELRQKLTGNLDGALFYDLGNVQLDHNDFFQGTGFRDGVGIGLRYVLPIGPIRLDFGINPDPRQGESRSVLQFTVGMAF